MPEFDKDSQFLKSNAAAMRALAGADHQVTMLVPIPMSGYNDVRLPSIAANRNSIPA